MKFILTAATAALLITAQCSGQCLSENDISSNFNKAIKSKLYAGQQEFSLSLLEQVNKVTKGENVFFSPYSVFHALLLAYFGSKGETERSLKNVLNLEWTDSKYDVMQAYRVETSMRMKRSRNSPVEFRSADRLFFDRSVKVKDCINDLFAEEIQTLDFANEPVQATNAVNKWVEDQTNGHIKDILSPGDLSEATKAVLANAAFFKGSWDSKFNVNNTKDEIFYTPTNQTFVPMMNKKGNFNHDVNEELGAHVLEIPYEGENTGMSFFIFLPPFSMPNGLENLLSKLNLRTFEQAIGSVSANEVDVKLPKFDFEKTLKIVPLLSQMGIGDVFQASANYTTFSDDHIVFDDATHKAKIQVDEEGSTAAAATVLFGFRSARPLENSQFYCNHPFLFLIYDHKSRAVLFTGIYRGPEL